MVVAGVAIAWCRGGDRGRTPDAPRASGPAPAVKAARPDPRRLERASLAGTIRDDARAPIARARVCVDLAATAGLPHELTRVPTCTTSDVHGRYALGALLAGEYRVSAMARFFAPAVLQPDGGRSWLALAAGEHPTGVDLVLHPGGVEITGTVSDLAGGPIAHAVVRATSVQPDAAVETDDAGGYTLWVLPGRVTVSSSAEGYSGDADSCQAPCTIDLQLVPASSLAGSVVDATSGAAVGGVQVVAARDGEELARDVSDDAGRFELAPLVPGRYDVIARSPAGYGRIAGSTPIGFAQHAGPVTVALHPAFEVSGHVELPGTARARCRDATLELVRGATVIAAERALDGTLHVPGVLPGRYAARPRCPGFRARELYPTIVVTDRDVADLAWPVETGATVRGRLRTAAGSPVAGRIAIRGSSLAAPELAWYAVPRDGSYELRGLAPGLRELAVEPAHGVARVGPWDVARVTIPSATAVVDHDVIVQDAGAITGSIVNRKGVPVADVQVAVIRGDDHWIEQSASAVVRTPADGRFRFENLAPASYCVLAGPGSWDRAAPPAGVCAGALVTVEPGAVATIRQVSAATLGTITGVVLDARRKPVSDALVTASFEEDEQGSALAYLPDGAAVRKTVTSADGAFELARLPNGTYTIGATLAAGGDAQAEHVAVGTSATLRIHEAASISGTVHGDRAAELIQIAIDPGNSDAERHETYFRTAGRYSIGGLAAGSYALRFRVGAASVTRHVKLADGEHKAGVDVELPGTVALTGRVLDAITRKPVAGIRMTAGVRSDEDLEDNTTGDDGRFTIPQAPVGWRQVTGVPPPDSLYPPVVRGPQGPVTVTASGMIDLGDLLLPTYR